MNRILLTIAVIVLFISKTGYCYRPNVWDIESSYIMQHGFRVPEKVKEFLMKHGLYYVLVIESITQQDTELIDHYTMKCDTYKRKIEFMESYNEDAYIPITSRAKILFNPDKVPYYFCYECPYCKTSAEYTIVSKGNGSSQTYEITMMKKNQKLTPGCY